ncbi:unnamed protein product [Phaeothamnion confervicola]
MSLTVLAGFERTLILTALTVLAFTLTGLLMDRRWIRDWRLLGLLTLSAAHAAFTPIIADMVSGPAIAALPWPMQIVGVLSGSALAQAGLWAETFLVTGMLIDALRRRRPTYYAARLHWKRGLVKGAMFGALFMALLQAYGFFRGSPDFLRQLSDAAALGAALGGAVLFCLARTIIESFDESPPFLARLRENFRTPMNYLRGVLLGFGLTAGLAFGVQHAAAASHRFVYGLIVGALVYAGADLLRDGFEILRSRRQRLQTWRIYALGAVLGGVVGGLIAWYFDAAQIMAVSQRMDAYATLYFPAIGKDAINYVIYPFFSRWGETDLGTAFGGARLLYNDSLAGVINWAIAAPLFSFNLVLLTALFERKLDPLRALFTLEGMTGVVEQMVRVLRWGLWMSPIIQTFLRMAPDPDWYNQDGAVRSITASIASITLPADTFRQWSLDVFMGLLAYEWLRILIWFDHMGLRVASLVNLSFVGGDRFDEWAARFTGHRARTRSLPEGIRRFATWAPLLIPFYIPRGNDWDYAWSGAERLDAAPQALIPAVGQVLMGYIIAGLLAIAIGTVAMRRVKRNLKPKLQTTRPDAFSLSNGLYSLQCDGDGVRYAAVLSQIRKGNEIDLTRRPQDAQDRRGKIFYLREMSSPGEPHGALWSITGKPAGIHGADCTHSRLSPAMARWSNSHDGIHAEATVELAENIPVEHWRIRLRNNTDKTRIVILTSYQEWALNTHDGYSRHPDYNALHVGTVFVRSLNAVMARNRLLHNDAAKPQHRRMSREIAFHAVHVNAGPLGQVQILGHEDCRTRFIGAGTLDAPQTLSGGQHRSVEDEGLLYSFDPAASLQLRVKIPPGGDIVIPFTDGYAPDEYAAAAYIQKFAAMPALDAAALDAVFARKRQLLLPPPAVPKTLPFEFSQDGCLLHMACDTVRPMAHMLANPLGHGAIIGNDGAIYSFAGNAQQNGLSAFCLDTVPALAPAQMIYVQDMDSGAIDTPCFVPHRRADAQHHAVYGRGYVEFHKSAAGREYQLDICIPPDQPVELRILTIRNKTARPARLRIVPYCEIALAELPRDSLGKIETAADAACGALYFRNPANDFHRGWAFMASSLDTPIQETVRPHFMGGAEYDLCTPYMVAQGRSDPSQPDDGNRIAALMGEITVPPQGESVIVVMLGQTATREEAKAVIQRHNTPALAQAALQKTKDWWKAQLSTLRVETNRPDFDRMVNDWLPYQVLTSRLWGRAGPNQRGGAYGYRDQLQDVLGLLPTHPELARKQILLHAAQQFREGDVLKWWHTAPEGGTGIGQRTSSGDPHLWLPYAVIRYLAASANMSLLDKPVAYLEGDTLARNQHHLLLAPRPSRDTGTVYNHCKRAIDLALSRLGANGLPLIGASDWNDGFDMTGIAGRGESVWLGFFLHDILLGFAGIAARQENAAVKEHYLQKAGSLRQALDNMWRGDRYVRMITDAGDEMTPLDNLSAAWPVLSGVTGLERGRIALETALGQLELGDMILLLDKYFDENSSPYPGRIADYPPGVRENGGQYSHGASWLVDALMRLSALAAVEGRSDLCPHFQARAAEIWLKISPLDSLIPGKWEIYGLAPHQQPADVYFGEGYEGRGGWSWYSGSAARMIMAAHALLGIEMRDGQLSLNNSLYVSKESPIRLRRVIYRGRELTTEN